MPSVSWVRLIGVQACWLALLHALNSDLLVVGFGKVWLAIYRWAAFMLEGEESHVWTTLACGRRAKEGYIGALLVHFWYTFGTLLSILVHFWYTFGTLLVHFWYTSGTVWYIYGTLVLHLLM